MAGASRSTAQAHPTEDWAALFRLLAEDQIKPVIAARFPNLAAAPAARFTQRFFEPIQAGAGLSDAPQAPARRGAGITERPVEQV